MIVPGSFSKNAKIQRLIQTILDELHPFLEEQADCIHELTSIGQSLGDHQNISGLLDKILLLARRFANADGGTLYLLDASEKELVFHVIHNDSLAMDHSGQAHRRAGLPNVPLYHPDGSRNLDNVSAYVVHTGQTVNIDDVYAAADFQFHGTRAFDRELNYRSKSMLVIPMANHEDTIIGVLQLINALDPKTEKILPFDDDAVRKASALATQASVMITQQNLIREMEALFDAFIQAIAVSIDEKSKHTGGHIQRVTDLAVMIAQKINQDQTVFENNSLSPEEIKELRMAALMHDTGKITTPDHVVNKSARLETVLNRIDLIRTRLQVMTLEEQLTAAQKKLDRYEKAGVSIRTEDLDSGLKIRLEQIVKIKNHIEDINDSRRRVTPADQEQIRPLMDCTVDIFDREQPILTPDEFENLCIPAGTLTAKERELINQHAGLTIKILNKLPWPRKMSNIPYIAGAHHEKLDGSGYPRGLKNEDLTLQARILAIADIFEALSASDRPYKPPMHLDQAFAILSDMAQKGFIDPQIVDLFIGSEIPQTYGEKYLSPDQLSR